jgi:hypothetical protein
MEIVDFSSRFFKAIMVAIFLLILFNPCVSRADDKKDTLIYKPYRDTVKLVKAQGYKTNDTTSLVFYKPTHFQFAKNVPSDFANFGKACVSKKNLPTLGILLGGTAVLVVLDQPITNAAQQFGRYLNISSYRNSKNVLAIKLGGLRVPVLDIPQNLNTSIYFLGEGWPSVMIAGGFYGYGAIAKDYRALQTSSQLCEMFITLAVTTQLIKRITGRESPFQSTQRGGKWRLFPNPGKYQKNVSHYDAFPSGHFATVMATITIISGNYPDNQYVKPIGYSIMGLLGFAMLNNGVHWISDYPVAIAIGYTYGRIAVSRGHVILPRRLSAFAKSSTLTPSIIGQNGFGLSYRYTF